MLPPRAPSWLFVRPRAIYDHPRLGRIVARAFDDASERALIERAERYGYDARVLDRAAIAWSAHNTLYVASGPLDGAGVASRLWDRLLNPRRRARDPLSDERLEGVLGTGVPASLLTAPGCSMLAYEEGPATRAVDRLIAPPPPGASPLDPDEILVWHTTQLPSQLVQATTDAALVHYVRELDLRVTVRDAGVLAVLTLRGALPPDAPDRIRRALAAVASSPLGELAGASSWLTASTTIALTTSSPPDLALTVTVPWPALSALADALRGDVGARGVD